jgi:hypothetical protein
MLIKFVNAQGMAQVNAYLLTAMLTLVVFEAGFYRVSNELHFLII